MAAHSITLLEKLLSKVQFDTNGGCWFYDGYWMPAGYGQFYFTRGTPVLAHRASWILHFGTIPIDMNVLHRCDTPPCFRPDHLFLGTYADNVADMIAKGRNAGPPIHCGSDNVNAVLRPADIPIIRKRLAVGDTQQAIADDFGVDQTSISSIKSGRTWKHC